MRDKKELRNLLAKIIDRGSCQRFSSKPFRPCLLHVIVSKDAPQYYNEEELAQLRNFCDQQVIEEIPDNNNMTQKRSYQIEDICEEETIKQVNKKPRKMNLSKNATPPLLPPPELPIEFMNKIRELNGSDIKFLMHKMLFNSDVCRNNNRLSMPENETMSDFLTEAEKETLNKREGSKGRLLGVEVIVLDPSLREFNLFLKKWNMKTSIYNLVTNWNSVVADNKLQQGEKLQIWSFRVDNKLHILLNKL